MQIDKYENKKAGGKRNLNWETNHVLITVAIDQLVRRNERMPTQQEIAEETGLRRQTVNVHLNQFKKQEALNEDLDNFEFMASKLLAKIMEKAMDGDMKASRLALQVIGLGGKKRAK